MPWFVPFNREYEKILICEISYSWHKNYRGSVNIHLFKILVRSIDWLCNPCIVQSQQVFISYLTKQCTLYLTSVISCYDQHAAQPTDKPRSPTNYKDKLKRRKAFWMARKLTGKICLALICIYTYEMVYDFKRYTIWNLNSEGIHQVMSGILAVTWKDASQYDTHSFIYK